MTHQSGDLPAQRLTNRRGVREGHRAVRIFPVPALRSFHDRARGVFPTVPTRSRTVPLETAPCCCPALPPCSPL